MTALSWGSGMKLHFLRSPKKRSAVLEQLYALLARRGFQVTESLPDVAVQDLDAAPQHDLYIVKSRTPLSISVAGMLHRRGARLLNPYPSCAALLDKIVVTAALRQAGIPTPRSWAAADPALLRSAAMAQRLPLVLKPFNGIHSHGIRVVSAPDQLSDGPTTTEPVLVQEFVEGCTERLKIHCVGERVFGTWKPFSMGGTHVPGQPREVGEEVRDIAVRCGRLFGLGLYGLDVLIGRRGPVVVDVNSFPGYKGLPAIAPILADYIARCARGEEDVIVPRHRTADAEVRTDGGSAVQTSGAPDAPIGGRSGARAGARIPRTAP
ncbi:MAG: ATP-grasp domain-containing protein [Candidatus Eisenbacteria bacterium]|uniref:ATP-grasp domain-containing protein n=1 Tax=Eiseniibacteriota bacterium TaxID=2212470 RepID=A0A538TIE7_UNCEI|nr:MAG: ATP-grasp domain-containing protein [Candidatus Eisenbacteria bacterium]